MRRMTWTMGASSWARERTQAMGNLARDLSCTERLFAPCSIQRSSSAMVPWMCMRLKNHDRKSWRPFVKTMLHVKGCFLDRDWGCDDFDRKSVSSGSLLTGGCKLRSRSRTTNRHALSSLRSLWLNIDTLLLLHFYRPGNDSSLC